MFNKTNNIYKVIQIIKNQDNFLNVCFYESNETNIELIEIELDVN